MAFENIIEKIMKNNFSDLILMRDNKDAKILDDIWDNTAAKGLKIPYETLTAKVNIHIKLNGYVVYLITAPAILDNSARVISYLFRKRLPKYMADLIVHKDDIIKAIKSLEITL